MTIVTNGNGKHDDESKRKVRASHLRWLKIGDLVPAPRAQREFRPAWAQELAASFNLEGMGFLVVSKRGDTFYVVDGQHRLAALKVLGFADDDTVQCEVYTDLSEQGEAELFLERNHSKTVAALDRFRVAVTAGRKDENEIEACVRHQGLRIGATSHRTRSASSGPAPISAVATLRKIYQRSGVIGLGKALRIIRDAYGEAGFEAAVIEGVGLLVHRYDGTLDEESMVKALSAASGGLSGLLTAAAKTRAAMGQPKGQCIAATAVSFYNRQPGTKRLAPWWKE